jgi:Lactonase, 7-bladed beta-propeller
MAVTPNGRFLMVGSLGLVGRIAVFRIAANGLLSPVPGSPFTTKSGAVVSSLEVNNTGSLAFVSEVDGALSQTIINTYTIASNGGLTPVASLPFNVASGDGFTLLLSPNQRFLFACALLSNSVRVLKVGVNGTLTEIAGSPFFAPSGEGAMTVDASGEFLYLNSSGLINGFRIAPEGKLSSVPNSPFLAYPNLGQPSIVAFPPKLAALTFDVCIEDDANGSILQISSLTGDYQFTACRKGTTLAGRGTVTFHSCKMEFQVVERDRRIAALVNSCTKVATASVQLSSPQANFTINDQNILNNSCVCK